MNGSDDEMDLEDLRLGLFILARMAKRVGIEEAAILAGAAEQAVQDAIRRTEAEEAT